MGRGSYQVTVIGSGMIANQSHIPALKLLGERVRGVSVQGRNPKTVSQTAAHHGIAGICAQNPCFQKEGKPDLVIITTPNASHAYWIRASLEAGCHVVCEKPLCIDFREAKELYALAEKQGVLLVCCQNLRFRRDFFEAKELVCNGTLGRVYYAQFDRVRCRGVPGWGHFRSRKDNLGGAMADIGVHLLDSLLWIMGNPEVESVLGTANALLSGVAPESASYGQPLDVEDFAAGMIRTREGICIPFKASWTANHPDETSIKILGTRAGLMLPECRIYRGDSSETYQGKALGEFDHLPYAGHYYLLEHVLNVLDGKESLMVRSEETLNVCKTLDLFYRSVAENREVKGSEL